jgi:lipopolysaccharide export LptBFGC system permease protein LptF
MTPIISIEFEYRQKTYFALVRIKEQKNNTTEYHITIMNGMLEQRLYGHHIFIEEDGEFFIGPVPEKEAGQLRLAVGMALCKHYNKPYGSKAV